MGHTLTIVIPALNEEEAIGSTVSRCLEARSHIIGSSPVSDVEVIVVSDGSSDRTEEIARSFDGVSVLAFDRNRGYGAAIKCGFQHAHGSLVGFIDADGTCDPRIFADLCRALDESGADVALGSRMGPQSRMPLVRVVGNRLFAWMLGLLAKRMVADTASGVRVIRRSSLEDLYPLPDGLHFTPAMSARVLLEDRLKLVEVPMPYSERVGRSKLSVIRDGIRFLHVIVRTALCYRPARPLLLGAAAGAVLTALIASGPVVFYLGERRLEEWMIYRILLSSLLATAVALLICVAAVAERIAATANDRPISTGPSGLAVRLIGGRTGTLVAVILTLVAVVTVWPGLIELLADGTVTMHWSRAVLAALLLVLAWALIGSRFLLRMMDLIQTQRRGESLCAPPDRVTLAGQRAEP